MTFSAIKGWMRTAWHILPSNIRLLFWKARGRCVPYQSIIFGGRVLLHGTDRGGAYRLIFPSPPIGKTVLDVGCHLWFLLFHGGFRGSKGLPRCGYRREALIPANVYLNGTIFRTCISSTRMH